MKTGPFLKEMRIAKRMDQKTLAKKLKISAQFVGRIEKGELLPPLKRLKRWCKLLEIESEWIIDFMLFDYETKLKKTFK